MNPPQATISTALSGHAPLTPALVDRLRKVCGREHVYTDADQLRTYESDGLLQYKSTPGVVVLPASTAEVRDVVKACSDAQRAVGRARCRLGPLGRGAARRGRRAHRAHAHARACSRSTCPTSGSSSSRA